MAKEHHVSAWLLTGYRKLVVRSESIAVEEAEKMDLRKAVLVCGLREKYHRRGYCQSEIDEVVLTTFASDFDEVYAMEAKYPTKEERKVMEAKRVKARAEEEAKVLARRASMMEEETRRQAVLEEYERQLEEQRENLSRLEKEKEQMLLNGPLPCSAEPQAAAAPFENKDTVCALFTAPFFELQLNLLCLGLCSSSGQCRQEEKIEEVKNLDAYWQHSHFESRADYRIDIAKSLTPTLISLKIYVPH
jgi:hypothetical protein